MTRHSLPGLISATSRTAPKTCAEPTPPVTLMLLGGFWRNLPGSRGKELRMYSRWRSNSAILGG